MKNSRIAIFFGSYVIYITILTSLAFVSSSDKATYLGLALLTNICWFILFFSLRQAEQANNSTINTTILSSPVLFFSALALRLPCLFIDPILEDDYYRYFWDGFISSLGINPYTYSPSYFFSIELPNVGSRLLDNVAYPDVKTVYSSISQYIFYFCYQIAPGSIYPLKFLIFFSELIILVQLMKKLAPQTFALYAFCPLFIHAFSINLHIDIIAVCFLMLSINTKGLWKGGLLAIACSIKPFALLVVPFIFQHVNTTPHHQALINFKVVYKNLRNIELRSLTYFLMIYVLIEAPLLTGSSNVFSNIYQASTTWAFNNPIYYLLSASMGERYSRLLLTLLFTATFAFVWLQYQSGRLNAYTAICLVFTAFVCFSPVANAWYLIWPLIMACFTQYRWLYLMSVFGWLSYFTGMNLNQHELALYQIPTQIMLLEWGGGVLFSLFYLRQHEIRSSAPSNHRVFISTQEESPWKDEAKKNSEFN